MTAPEYNLARFDFVSIRLAVRCAQCGSLTLAARDCNLVLAAASRRLSGLENALGEPLFARHSRGLVATEAGQVFLHHGLALLQEMDKLVAELRDVRHGVMRHIRLCSSTAVMNQFLPRLLVRYAELNTGVRVDLEEQLTGPVLAALREGRADLGAYVEGPDTHGLEVCDFRTDELVLALPAGHSLVGRTPIGFAETLDEQWISLDAGSDILRRQRAAALATGRTFKLRMQVRSYDAVGHLVASGMGIAMLPKSLACRSSAPRRSGRLHVLRAAASVAVDPRRQAASGCHHVPCAQPLDARRPDRERGDGLQRFRHQQLVRSFRGRRHLGGDGGERSPPMSARCSPFQKSDRASSNSGPTRCATAERSSRPSGAGK